MKVEDVMTVNVVAVRPDATLKQVAEVMQRRGISGMPVADGEKRVLGVVSEAEIIMKAASRPESAGIYGRLFMPEGVDERRVAAATAGEAMSTPPITVDADQPVAEAARLMVEHRVNRLPVLVDGRLAGIVSRADLVRAFTRSDEEIRRELLDDVVVGALWLSPEGLEVDVVDGRVVIRGRVAKRTQADLVEAFAWRVPGVVSVDRTGLDWETDDRARRRARLEAEP